ncbi:DNA photolyase [Aspergillus sclerotiicarbonarius CBS 121057]|uniref:DNA photolyase n=1 Tax=Aspergillus sclerotiicarbonarius (strain CBS 121057 / IBT 28362) TaxID=1448318 RepID=A0A319EZ75_ASPSB|nr:DNA photolyase [Aspergillus sclerotiicarbonarius CBS 121057]
MPRSNGPIVLFWHRTDLRLHDNPALKAALDLNPSIFIPIFTWDPHYVYHARVGPNRWRFLLECQKDVSASYTKLNPQQQLWVVREAPQNILPKLWKTWDITHLVFEKDTDAYARDRDDEVVKLAEKAGVNVIMKNGRTLFDPDEVVRCNKGEPTMSITQLQKATEKINDGVPEKPVETPNSIPDPWDEDRMDLSKVDQTTPESEPDLNAVHRTKSNTQYCDIMGTERNFAIPSLEEIGIDPSQATTPHHGGESVALKTLATCIQDEEYVSTFEKPKTSPADFDPQSTTLLSPHLHFGTLSVRKFWWDIQTDLDHRKSHKKPISHPPTNLPGQLLFREMFFAAQAALGHSYSQTRGNKIARFIPWHLQSTTHPAGTYTIDDPQAETWFRRWKQARTGFPWIDALMRQLKQEGWIHHLGRHSVACFLTRGGCYVSWERGAEVFEEWLIDHEPASNIGNWMWLSCTAFFTQFYRCYSPVAFGRKWDPEGWFVRQYCPELSQYDKKFIYEPWKAPIADQRRWKCRVVGDGSSETDSESGLAAYPTPMFDFGERRDTCIAQMKKAYQIRMYGDDARVMDGSWRDMFGFEVKDGRVRDEMNGDGVHKRGRKASEHDDEDGSQQPTPKKRK